MAYTVTKGSQIVGFICKNSAYLEQIAKYFGNVLSTNVLLHSKDIRLLSKVSDCLGHPEAWCSEPAWLDTLVICGSYHCTASQDGGLPLRRSSCRLSALWFRTAQTSSSCSGPPLTCSASARDTCMLPVGSQNTTMLFLQSLSLYILHTSRTVTSAHWIYEDSKFCRA